SSLEEGHRFLPCSISKRALVPRPVRAQRICRNSRGLVRSSPIESGIHADRVSRRWRGASSGTRARFRIASLAGGETGVDRILEEPIGRPGQPPAAPGAAGGVSENVAAWPGESWFWETYVPRTIPSVTEGEPPVRTKEFIDRHARRNQRRA